MFLEVVATPEQLFAFPMKTLVDSRRPCVVFCHVQLVKTVIFDILSAQQARVNNGGVHSFLVMVYIIRNLGRVRAARDVAGVLPHLSVALHVQLQVVLFAEKFTANATRALHCLEVHFHVLLQFRRGREQESAPFKAALDFARN
jgi:hypothetical protein